MSFISVTGRNYDLSEIGLKTPYKQKKPSSFKKLIVLESSGCKRNAEGKGMYYKGETF